MGKNRKKQKNKGFMGIFVIVPWIYGAYLVFGSSWKRFVKKFLYKKTCRVFLLTMRFFRIKLRYKKGSMERMMNFMSTLEKTIDLLLSLPEQQVETVYSFARFLSLQPSPELPAADSLEDILNSIVGAVPDSGKTLEEYREERIRERYELTD
jgi:hypothetical protein